MSSRRDERLQGQPSWHRSAVSPSDRCWRLIYCMPTGSSLEPAIERATHRDIGARFVAANVHPDRPDRVFRRDNLAAFGESFLQFCCALEACQGRACQRRRQQVRGLCASTVRRLMSRGRADRSELDIADRQRAAAADGEGETTPRRCPLEIARREAAIGWMRRVGASRLPPRRAPRPSGRTTRPRWRRARRASPGQGQAPEGPTRRRAPTSRAI